MTALIATAVLSGVLVPTVAAASSPSGSPSWTKQFGAAGDDRFNDVDATASGYTVAVGTTTGTVGSASLGQTDAIVVSYDRNGRRRWVRQFGTTADDDARSVAVAPNGDTYVVGYTTGGFGVANAGPDGGEDVFLAKFDRNGRRKWVRQFGAPGDDEGLAVAVVGTSTVYVSGSTVDDITPGDAFDPLGSRDLFLARYDRDGNRAWIRQVGSDSSDRVSGIAIAPAADVVYVTGTTVGAMPGQSQIGAQDGYLVWFDTNGNDLRYRQFGTDGTDETFGVAADSSGDAYVAGRTSRTFGATSAGGYDGFVVKYSAAGNQVWVTQDGTDSDDGFHAIAAGPTGTVTVTGVTSSDFAAPNGGDSLGDIVTARYDQTTGTRRWAHQFGSTLADRASGIAITSKDDVLAVGDTDGAMTSTASGGGIDAFITRYPASRNRSWGLQIGTSTYDAVLEIAPTTGARILVGADTLGSLAGANAGQSDAVVMRVDASGKIDLQRQISSDAYDGIAGVGSDAAGNIYVLVNTNGSIGEASHGSTDASLTKYDVDGNLLWQRMYGTTSGDAATALAVTPGGTVYIGGWTYGSVGQGNFGSTDPYLLRIDPASGGVIWSQQFGTVEPDYLSAIAAAPNGDLFVTGQTYGPLGRAKPSNEDGDLYVARFDRNGNRKWLRQSGDARDDDAHSIAVTPAGDAVIVGVGTAADDSTIPVGYRYDRNGRLRWQRRFLSGLAPAPSVSRMDVALDARGNAYVVGGVSGTWSAPLIGQVDAFLVRLDRNGRASFSRAWGTTQFDQFTTVTIGAGGALYAGGMVGLDNSFAGPSKGQYDGVITRIAP